MSNRLPETLGRFNRDAVIEGECKRVLRKLFLLPKSFCIWASRLFPIETMESPEMTISPRTLRIYLTKSPRRNLSRHGRND